MSTRVRTFWWLYWGVVLASLAGTTAMLFLYTPVERTMGPVQKIFYLHLPSAINGFLACLVVFAASVGYLWQRKMWWDDLAAAAARVAVMMCTIVLITGMVWAKGAWGKWWTWSPRLTFSLLLWLLYVVYLIIRPSIESRQRRAVVGAVYGVVAFLDVPLVYLSVRLMPDIHPVSVEMGSAMKLTLGLWFIPVTLMAGGLIASHFFRYRRQHSRQTASGTDALASAV